MAAIAWESLIGEVILNRYRIRELRTSEDREAIFTAAPLESSGAVDATVALTATQDGGPIPPAGLHNLRYPHLRVILDSGVQALRGTELHCLLWSQWTLR